MMLFTLSHKVTSCKPLRNYPDSQQSGPYIGFLPAVMCTDVQDPQQTALPSSRQNSHITPRKASKGWRVPGWDLTGGISVRIRKILEGLSALCTIWYISLCPCSWKWSPATYLCLDLVVAGRGIWEILWVARALDHALEPGAFHIYGFPSVHRLWFPCVAFLFFFLK